VNDDGHPYLLEDSKPTHMHTWKQTINDGHMDLNGQNSPNRRPCDLNAGYLIQWILERNQAIDRRGWKPLVKSGRVLIEHNTVYRTILYRKGRLLCTIQVSLAPTVLKAIRVPSKARFSNEILVSSSQSRGGADFNFSGVGSRKSATRSENSRM
jgi:hypothetical protein